MESNIVEGLKHLVVPIQALNFDPKNTRKHDERNLTAIKASLTKFGQRLPVVVQKNGMIVRAGNGRLEAMKEMGWSEVAALIVDEDDVNAVAFSIADNRSAELAEWDFGELSEALNMLGESDPDLDLEALGWSDSEIEGLSLANSWDDFDFENSDGLGERESNAGSVQIKFTAKQFDAIQQAANECGFEGPPDAASITELCTMTRRAD